MLVISLYCPLPTHCRHGQGNDMVMMVIVEACVMDTWRYVIFLRTLTYDSVCPQSLPCFLLPAPPYPTSKNVFKKPGPINEHILFWSAKDDTKREKEEAICPREITHNSCPLLSLHRPDRVKNCYRHLVAR